MFRYVKSFVGKKIFLLTYFIDQVSNGSHAMTVEFFPLLEENLNLPPPLGNVTINESSVLKGEVSDDECRHMPCAHGASCRNTWNDFE